ncbi:MAG: SusD/RagB family nutrient-binding outer membrane lipoprotein, partial [Bacteroidales bacterium]|nr:SusD/RagB family nutrient-binding outer membrane lipoprotein [Bacteroidales bacterium]
WWNNWLQPPSNASIPTLARLISSDPSAGYDQSNFPARMMRPFLSINFEKPNAPGILITSAEVNFLLAEAASKGWEVTGDVTSLFEAGVHASMVLLNELYLPAKNNIAEELISEFITGLKSAYNLSDPEQAREAINTQAWILHMTNPNEAWANLRRSDYPVLVDRTKLPKFLSDFTYDDDIKTPVRLRYPKLEEKYNSASLQEAKDRMGGTDNWHTHVWWDKNDINVK